MAEAVNGWNHRIRLRGVGKRAGGIDGTAMAAAFGGVAGVRPSGAQPQRRRTERSGGKEPDRIARRYARGTEGRW
jgi:hypothetical protein